MTVKAIMPVRLLNPVEPLAHQATAMRNQDTGEPQQLALWSGAVSEPIGQRLGLGDVDSSNTRRTPATTPSSRTSRTAIRTGTTRTTGVGFVPSADPIAPSSPEPAGAPFQMADLVQAEWKEAVLNQLAIHAMDAPVTDSPAVVIQKIIDMAVVMATDPAIGGVKPVQAEPLTYEAVERIWVNAPTGKTVAETRMDFARAIEAAHGIATTPEVRNAM